MSNSITSYGDRPNEVDAVVSYFKAHFTQVHTRNNEGKRVLYTHLTSVVVGVLWSGSMHELTSLAGHEGDAKHHLERARLDIPRLPQVSSARIIV